MGKRHFPSVEQAYRRKHPHGRGEESASTIYACCIRETPPRAWGRDNSGYQYRRRDGNTPTGVGKSFACNLNCLYRRKHPHGRGEERKSRSMTEFTRETPPRAWGRGSQSGKRENPRRNTPTGVGKSANQGNLQGDCWKHPHGRGEELLPLRLDARERETSPRAWGREHTQVLNNLSIIAYFFHLSKSQVRSVLIFL